MDKGQKSRWQRVQVCSEGFEHESCFDEFSPEGNTCDVTSAVESALVSPVAVDFVLAFLNVNTGPDFASFCSACDDDDGLCAPLDAGR